MADAVPVRRLLLLRHAKAVAGPDGTGGDHDRDLSERGCRDAVALGERMRRLALRPELALVSSALRTRRTWELLAPFEAPPPVPEILDRLYLAGAATLLAALHEIPDGIVTTLLVGHNPGLHELALHLGGGPDGAAAAALPDGMPTCCLVDVTFEAGWRDLQPHAVRQVRVIRA